MILSFNFCAITGWKEHIHFSRSLHHTSFTRARFSEERSQPWVLLYLYLCVVFKPFQLAVVPCGSGSVTGNTGSRTTSILLLSFQTRAQPPRMVISVQQVIVNDELAGHSRELEGIPLNRLRPSCGLVAQV